MNATLMDQFKKRIDEMGKAQIFSNSDFFDIAQDKLVRTYMSRLVEEKKIERIMNGLFFKLEKMSFVDDYVYPSILDVAQAIAKKFVWNIYPDGITSLNILGLSTQVPAQYTFISDGPYRDFKIFNSVIKFKHTANREISRVSYKSSLVIQAIKALGNNITMDQKRIIESKLSLNDKKELLKDSACVAEWLRNIIKEIFEVSHE